MRKNHSEATARPWTTGPAFTERVESFGRVEGYPIAGHAAAIARVWNGSLDNGKANADLIVKCVNAHGPLVEALKHAIRELHKLESAIDAKTRHVRANARALLRELGELE